VWKRGWVFSRIGCCILQKLKRVTACLYCLKRWIDILNKELKFIIEKKKEWAIQWASINSTPQNHHFYYNSTIPEDSYYYRNKTANPKHLFIIELLKNVYIKFKNKSLSLLIFIPAALVLEKDKELCLRDMTIITNGYEKFKALFNVPTCCEKFYIFDKSGNLVKEGFNSIGYTGR